MTLAADTISCAIGGSRLLDEVSLALRPGELTLLLGPNGAGKTSLLTCLAGVRQPTSGRITLAGEPLADLHPLVRATSIGYLPQTTDVPWALDVRTVVGLGRLPHRGPFGGLSAADHQAIDAALVQTDTAQFASRSILSLSGGERARVLLARVLAGAPRWILADEPLTHLDPAHQLDVLDLLWQAARRGAGVCAVLHDLSLAARFADRLILMQHGRLVADGTAHQVLTEENLLQVYQVRADIRHENGTVSVTPLARANLS